MCARSGIARRTLDEGRGSRRAQHEPVRLRPRLHALFISCGATAAISRLSPARSRLPKKLRRSRRQGIAARVFATRSRRPLHPGRPRRRRVPADRHPDRRGGDPVLARFGDAVAVAPRLALDRLPLDGRRLRRPRRRMGRRDDAAAPIERPRAPAGRRRGAWLDLGGCAGKAVQVFRLAGIYGPGRNALVNLAEGTAQRIVKPGRCSTASTSTTSPPC